MGCLDMPSRKKGKEKKKVGNEQNTAGSNYNNTLLPF